MYNDQTITCNGKSFTWFGYLSTIHFSVVPLTVFPILFAVGIPATIAAARRTLRVLKEEKQLGPLFWAMVGVIYVALNVAWDVSRSLTEYPEAYAQWNYFRHTLVDVTGTASWYCLYILSMLLYLAAFTLTVGYSLGATSLVHSIWERHNPGEADSHLIHNLCYAQRIIVTCAIAYVVILRCTKVDEHLRAVGVQIQIESVFDYAGLAQPYLEAASRGLWRNIITVGLLVLLALRSHVILGMVAIKPSSAVDTTLDRVEEFVERTSLGWQLLPAWFRLVVGVGMVATVAPPPSPLIGAQVLLVMCGLFVARGALKKLGAGAEE
ncbi:MAG: hypothetical protein DPW14_03725 [Planctomycetes bacterium]|nr:hypothetical protein [Planctomycetota bacterium]